MRNNKKKYAMRVLKKNKKTKFKLSLIPLGEKDIPQWSASKTGIYSCSYTWDAVGVK
jgi:hypothetical protein